MAQHPEQEEPGFEHDVNELDPAKTNTSETSTEEDADEGALEEVQEEAAHERQEEGGYQ